MAKRDETRVDGVEPAAPPAEPRDVLFVYGKDDTGNYGVIRKREDQVELGRLCEAKEGQPIHGELVNLRPRPEHAQLFDVDVVHDARPSESRSGPPQVATTAYRENWDRVFGARPRGASGLEN
jgi:hypothetical protein